jgi:ribosome-binding protein aMBF1 (putative translation factor)
MSRKPSRRRRQRRVWSYYEAGKLLDINRESIAQYVRGDCYPDLYNMRKIEACLGWPLAEQLELIPFEDKRDRNHAYGLALEFLLNDELGWLDQGAL